MNGNDKFLNINDAHLRVTGGNVHASSFNLDQISIVTTSTTSSTIDFLNETKAFTARSNIEVGTANLFVNTETSNVGIRTDAPEYALDVHGPANVSVLTANTVTGLQGTLLLGSHLLPTQHEQFDLGSAEKKIRHLFLSDNSLWIGDEAKISFVDEKMKFLKRNKTIVPSGLVELGLQQDPVLNAATLQTNAIAATEDVSAIGDMKLEHWLAYTKTLTGGADKDIKDIFTTDASNYETISASDAFKEVGDDIFSTRNVAIGKNTAPTTALDVVGTVTATSFSGSGSALTALNAEKIESGTLSVDRGGTGTTTSTGTGSVVLSDTPSFTGDVTFDTDTLKIDATNTRVGIGTTTPQEKFHLYGAPMIQHDTVYQEVSGSNVWYKLGVWNTSGQGANLKLTLLGGSGYNAADNNKGGETIIYAKLLNNQDTSVANIGGMFHSVGNPTVYQVKFKQVLSNRDQYEVHAEVPSYTVHNMSIECSLTTSFMRDFTSSGDPGVDSATVRAAKFTHVINESGNVGIGTDNPGTKLSVYDISSNLTAASIITKGGSIMNEPSFSILDMKDAVGAGGYIKGFHNPYVSHGIQFGSITSDSRNTELMTILDNGNVGIGIDNNLNAPLTIFKSGAGYNQAGGGITFARSIPAGFRGASIWSYAKSGINKDVLAFGVSESSDPYGGTPNMFLDSAGRLQFGNTTKQHINLYGTESYGFGVQSYSLYARFDQQLSFHSSGVHSDARSDPGAGGTMRAYIDHSSGGNRITTFTGQHKSFPHESLSGKTVDELSGLIVCASGEHVSINDEIPQRGQQGISVSEAVPVVRLSTEVGEKTVFGVISNVEDIESKNREQRSGNFTSVFEKIVGDTRIYINSLGEGAIWVVNTNGSLTNGDYITTSNVVGYGQKQDSDTLKNYTVAKITMDCNFMGTLVPKKRIKKKTVTETNEEIVTEEYEENMPETKYTYDIEKDCYVKTIKDNKKIKSRPVKQEYELRDSDGNIITESYSGNKVIVKTVTHEVNDLDEHGQLQWEDHPIETEKAYKIRYLDASGVETDEASAVHKAAFVGCTYHCG